MDKQRWQLLEAIFERALAAPAARREALVRETAGGDESLAADALRLLAAHEGRHALLDAPRAAELAGGLRIGAYAIDHVIGSGGMGVVYLAHRADGQFSKRVAVKLLTAGLAATFDDRRAGIERQALASLDHPNIAKLLDSGITSYGQPYLVMEYVEGQPLDAWCKAAPRSRGQVLDAWLAIANAVAAAHGNLIVHGDLKPANILMDTAGVPKLLDFGAAKLLAEGSAPANTRYYTASYASPEQKAGGPVTTAADIHGLGLLLRELLTGHRVEGDLAAIIGMARREQPARRYGTVAQFAEDVQRFRRGEPVTAQPDSAAYRIRRFVGRHRLAVGAAATAVVAIAATAAIALWQAQRARFERNRAEQVTTYLADMLGGAALSPDNLVRERGAAVRLSELVEQAERKLDANPPPPEVEMELRQVIAQDYYQMGLYPQAERNVRRGLALAGSLGTREDSRRNQLGVLDGAVDLALGRFASAERKLSSLRQTRKGLPAFSRATLASNLGTAQLRLGRVAEAEQTFAEGIRAAEGLPGSDQSALLWLLSNSSLVPTEQGRFSESISRLRRAAAIGQRLYREPRTSMAWVLTNLGLLSFWTGDHDAALRDSTEALRTFEATLGANHPSTIHPIGVMAAVLAGRGDAGAEPLMRRGVAAQSALDASHFERAVGLTFLGLVLMQQGKLAEARPALEEALVIRRKAFQAPNWRIAETEGLLGECLARMGRHSEARKLLASSTATFERVYGLDNPRTRTAIARQSTWTGAQ